MLMTVKEVSPSASLDDDVLLQADAGRWRGFPMNFGWALLGRLWRRLPIKLPGPRMITC